MRSKLWTVLALFCSLLAVHVSAQKTTLTLVKGKVIDADSKEGLAFVSVNAPGFAAGTRTDENGFYLLRTEQKITKIQFNYLGYQTQYLTVKPGEDQTIDVALKPSAQQLQEVTVKAKKYKKKDNPVIELIELVIANRSQNHLEDLKTYQDEQYEKIFLGLSNLNPNLKTSRLLRPMRFVL